MKTCPNVADKLEHRDVYCGETLHGRVVLCSMHFNMYLNDYPQGWNYYPGDVCRHGNYIGGSGVDRLCVECELG